MDDIDKIAFLIEAHDRGRFDEMREIMEARPARITPSDAPKKRQWAKTDELSTGEIIKGAFSTIPGARIKSDPSKYAEIRAAAENNPFKVAMDAYKHEQYGNRQYGSRNKKGVSASASASTPTLHVKARRDQQNNIMAYELYSTHKTRAGKLEYTVNMNDLNALKEAVPIFKILADQAKFIKRRDPRTHLIRLNNQLYRLSNGNIEYITIPLKDIENKIMAIENQTAHTPQAPQTDIPPQTLASEIPSDDDLEDDDQEDDDQEDDDQEDDDQEDDDQEDDDQEDDDIKNDDLPPYNSRSIVPTDEPEDEDEDED